MFLRRKLGRVFAPPELLGRPWLKKFPQTEVEHAHRRTYRLERDATTDGLIAVRQSGSIFKTLENFQWNLLLQTDVVSDEHLGGCDQLAQILPNLCSSIFLAFKPRGFR